MNRKSYQIISKAPGRICLFGDHQDYLQLPVIACAIDLKITINAESIDEEYFKVFKKDLNEVEIIGFNEEPKGPSDFIRIANKVLRKNNCIPDKGYKILISGNIPINAGLSSSSALTIAWIQFMIQAYGINQTITPLLIAKLAYQTEVLEYNSSGGKMDQYTISFGNTIYLNTSNDYMEHYDHSIETLIIGVSGEAKDTLGTLGNLKNKALKAIEMVRYDFPEFNLFKANNQSITNYSRNLDDESKLIFEAAIKNHSITKSAQGKFNSKDLDINSIGRLMNEHHLLLKENLRITTQRIDEMIDNAISAGAIGAKIVGSGGGGCIVALAESENVPSVIQGIKNANALDAFAVKITSGANVDKIKL